MKEETGFFDRNRQAIREGDLVEFHFNHEYGYTSKPHPNFVTMVDEVRKVKGVWYFIDMVAMRGGLAEHHAPYCRVIGSIYDCPKEFRSTFNEADWG